MIQLTMYRRKQDQKIFVVVESPYFVEKGIVHPYYLKLSCTTTPEEITVREYRQELSRILTFSDFEEQFELI